MLLVVFPLYYFTSLNILPQFFNFRLLSYFTETLPWFLRPVKTCTSSQLYSGYFWLFTFIRFFYCQFVSCYRKHYGFKKAFFTFLFFFTFWGIFGLDENRIIPSRILPYACSHRVICSGQHMILSYRFHSCKCIVL